MIDIDILKLLLAPSDPAVSVVIPCYNAGAFVWEVIETLAAQTFRAFETIIVDDGSNDEATERALAAAGACVTVIRQPNKGPAAARNAGIAAARAPLVLVLDCDDKLAPTFLDETVPVLRSAPQDVGYVFTDMRLSGLNDRILPQHFSLFDQLFVNRVPCCLLMRKAAWQASGGYDEAMLEGFEDWEFTIALAAAGLRGLHVAQPLFIYRVNDEGRMMSRAAQQHGKLWGYIRRKHAALYRPLALWRLWWRTRAKPGEISLPRAFLMLALGAALPTLWADRLFYRVRLRRHLARIAERTGHPVPGV
jgi:glycosyltransferase involved in cell wall biosynthesis